MSGDTVYFELMDYMQDNACPLCALIDERVKNSLDSFLFECVNDPSTRIKLNSSGGLCDVHSKMLLEMGDPLAHAILYEGLINNALKNIKKSDYSPYLEHTDCKYCKQVRLLEDMYVKAFVKGMADDEFSEKYRRGGMLCLAHLGMVKQCCPKPKRKEDLFLTIKNITTEKYKLILENLSEIQRKSDYRFNEEQWTADETKAWKKAVGIINDKSFMR